MILYLLSVVVCLPVFIWYHWYEGNDLRADDLGILTVWAIIPAMNVMILFMGIILIIKDWVECTQFRVLLKGRE